MIVGEGCFEESLKLRGRDKKLNLYENPWTGHRKLTET